MSTSVHERARGLIECAGAAPLPDVQHEFLRNHMQQCDACRDYKRTVDKVAPLLRIEPVVADSALIRATKQRIVARAAQLRVERERVVVVALTVGFFTVCGTLSMVSEWYAFTAWGTRNGVSPVVGRSLYGLCCLITPLVVGVLLLGHRRPEAGASAGDRA